MRLPLSSLIFILSNLQNFVVVTSQPFTNCDVSTYYSSVNLSNRDEMHSRIQSSQLNSLSYSEVWDALTDIDSDASGQNVRLIYSDEYVPALPRDAGTCGYWNREHLWPRSRGIADNGYDHTDLHHMRPSDCNVNAARSNLLFGECGTASTSTCTIPAHPEAAVGTEKDNMSFLPPKNVRGDIARAILYMDLRYDGDESNTNDLVVSDCPDSVPNSSGMGYLSQLLEWHAEDPVDDNERARNDAVCKQYQGNRNPFVDYPELATKYFGVPKQPMGNGLGYDCSSPPPPSSTPSPTPAGKGTCRGMTSGDVAVIGVKSTDPDMVALLATADLPAGATIFITDNAWTGYELKTNEGAIKLDVTSAIAAGTRFGFDAATNAALPLSDSWEKESGSLALSVSGDNVMVYCLEGDGSKQFLYAVLIQSDWYNANVDSSAFSPNESALPSNLPDNCNIAPLNSNKRNWWYQRTVSGSKTEMLNAIADPTNWASDDVAFDLDIGPATATNSPVTNSPTNPPTPNPTNQPVTKAPSRNPVTASPTIPAAGSCLGMTAGDVAVIGVKSTDPDAITLLATADLPPGATVYITDNAWTGYELKTNEGAIKLDVTSAIAAGTRFGFDAATNAALPLSDSWEKESGSLALSVSGDNVMVYCLEGDGSKQFLYAVLIQSDWSNANADSSAFSPNESALPSNLPDNCSVALNGNKRNWWYQSEASGTKMEMLNAIADPINWASDDVAFDAGGATTSSPSNPPTPNPTTPQPTPRPTPRQVNTCGNRGDFCSRKNDCCSGRCSRKRSTCW
eukprot:g5445.t1 g5445   contig2:553941-556609(-)